MKPILAVTIVAVLLAGCAAVPGSQTSAEAPDSAPSTRNVDGCPVTVPPQPGLVPPEPYPREPAPPAPAFEQVWYGTSGLWTTLDPNGAVWDDLPVQPDGSIGDKTLWFSENFSTAGNEDFAGDSDITVTAEHLDGVAPAVVEQGGVPSFNRHLKNFILVGFGVPEPGCWEVTASYKGAELSYVMYVEDGS